MGERSFQKDILEKEKFVVTLELVPGAESGGRSVDRVMAIAKDALTDGRISAVTITQLGYDARKFKELLQIQKKMGLELATLGSLYVLTPKAARVMNSGKVPGAVVTGDLLEIVQAEWQEKNRGRTATIERSARLGTVLKGLGYRGIHIGGVLSSFEMVGSILDRMSQIESDWQDHLHEFNFPQKNGYYIFSDECDKGRSSPILPTSGEREKPLDKALFQFLRGVHHTFFRFDAPFASFYARLCSWLDRHPFGRVLVNITEDPLKKLLLSCRKCGDCGIQHLASLCPESRCPKRIRNGACGGSKDGMCEVYPDRECVWVRTYKRWALIGQTERMSRGCVPPRIWALDRSSSWLNFHLHRDHQSASCGISQHCGIPVCSQQASPASAK